MLLLLLFKCKFYIFNLNCRNKKIKNIFVLHFTQKYYAGTLNNTRTSSKLYIHHIISFETSFSMIFNRVTNTDYVLFHAAHRSNWFYIRFRVAVSQHKASKSFSQRTTALLRAVVRISTILWKCYIYICIHLHIYLTYIYTSIYMYVYM